MEKLTLNQFLIRNSINPDLARMFKNYLSRYQSLILDMKEYSIYTFKSWWEAFSSELEMENRK